MFSSMYINFSRIRNYILTVLVHFKVSVSSLKSEFYSNINQISSLIFLFLTVLNVCSVGGGTWFLMVSPFQLDSRDSITKGPVRILKIPLIRDVSYKFNAVLVLCFRFVLIILLWIQI